MGVAATLPDLSEWTLLMWILPFFDKHDPLKFKKIVQDIEVSLLQYVTSILYSIKFLYSDHFVVLFARQICRYYACLSLRVSNYGEQFLSWWACVLKTKFCTHFGETEFSKANEWLLCMLVLIIAAQINCYYCCPSFLTSFPNNVF